MAYALSFAKEFFWGDPDAPHDTRPPSDRPACVYDAVVSLSAHEWAELARDVFRAEPEHLDIDSVVHRAITTNTCTNLDPPVEVWIDSEGWYRLLIYDRKEESCVPRSTAPA